jgi:hypothetical protein
MNLIKILIADSDPDTVIYNATWYNDPVLALDPTGPWALIKQGEENETSHLSPLGTSSPRNHSRQRR